LELFSINHHHRSLIQIGSQRLGFS